MGMPLQRSAVGRCVFDEVIYIFEDVSFSAVIGIESFTVSHSDLTLKQFYESDFSLISYVTWVICNMSYESVHVIELGFSLMLYDTV